MKFNANSLAAAVMSTTPVESMSRDDLRAAFEAYRSTNEHNEKLIDMHPAFAAVCDFRDDMIVSPEAIKRLEAIIDRVYDAKSLSACNEGWGGLDNVDSAKSLIRQCYLFDVGFDEAPDHYAAMLACGYIEEEDMTAD